MINNHFNIDTCTSSANPWNVMTVVGNQSLTYNVSLTGKVSEAYIEVYASPHGEYMTAL